MKVVNKVIVVTGGGNGIGRELVFQLLTKGARVAAVDIDEAKLKETVSLAGGKGKLSMHMVNVTDRSAVEKLPAEVIKAHGAVDGLINNAGIIQKFVRFNDLDYKEIERVLNVNLYGVIYMTKTFLPKLLMRPEGHIVNVSSMGGFLPVPGQTIYGASKAGVTLLTEGLYTELLPTNVGVTVVFPGAIRTNIAANSGVSTGSMTVENSSFKMTSPVVAAAKIVDGIEKKRYRVMIGSDAAMMDKLFRLAPERAAKLIYAQMKSLLAD
ncbi:MAG: SDR family oxidoreductase [Anaerolineaceae bacterium]|nr:SDR family oxidoreductase [Anaerolineaceae bacterium]MBN2678116.1 SDR family oxidoreductase [Anaerolineaceae bacterium]